MTIPADVKIGLGGWLRIALRLAAMLLLLAICLVLYPFGLLVSRRNPVSRLFLTGALRIAGGSLRVVGNRPRTPVILLANHSSWLDIPALAAATGSVFVAHAGLADHPAMRTLCRLHRTVFIARDRRTSVAGQVDQVRSGLAESGILTLFPEGTTDDGVSLLPFKSSLLAAIENGDAEIAVQPVWIDYGADAAEIAWFGEEPGLDNLKRVLARTTPITVTVHLLAPLSVAQRCDRKTIAAAARDAVLTAMKSARAA